MQSPENLSDIYSFAASIRSQRSEDWPASEVDAGTLCENLLNSGLTSEQLLASVKDRILQSGAEVTVESLLDALNGTLSQWQIGKLLRGFRTGFFIGDWALRDHLGTGRACRHYLARAPDEESLVRASVVLCSRKSDRKVVQWIEERLPTLAQVSVAGTAYHGKLEERYHRVFLRELIRGFTLGETIAAFPSLPLNICIEILQQLAGNVSAIHEAGMTLLTLNAENTLVCDKGGIRVTTVGLPPSWCRTRSVPIRDDDFPRHLFVAPEVLSQDPVDHRADVYSFGAILFFLLSGSGPPRIGGREALEQILRGGSTGEKSKGMRHISRSLATNPSSRVSSISDLIGGITDFFEAK